MSHFRDLCFAWILFGAGALTQGASLVLAQEKEPTPKPPLAIEVQKRSTLEYSDAQGNVSSTFRKGYQRRESLRLGVKGNIFGSMRLFGEFQENDAFEDESTFFLRLKSQNFEAFLGEFGASDSGAAPGLAGRRIQGGSVKGTIGKFSFSALVASPKGTPRYVKFYGQDSLGPYQLQAPVQRDSEIIKVDGVVQKRGTDYDIDYFLGTVFFLKDFVEDTSLIETRYEVAPGVYSRSLIDTKVGYQFFPAWTLRVGYFEERDSRKGADAAFRTSGIPPTLSQIFTVEQELKTKKFRLLGSWSGNRNDANTLLTDAPGTNATLASGYRGQTRIDAGPFRLVGDGHWLEPDFSTAHSADLQGVKVGYSAGLDYKAKFPLTFDVKANHQESGPATSRSILESIEGSARIKTKRLPEPEYRFHRRVDADGTTRTASTQERHQGSLTKRWKRLTLTLGGAQDRRKDFPGLADEEISRQVFSRLNISSKVFSGSLGAEYGMVEGKGSPNEETMYRDLVQTYRINMNFKPGKFLSFSPYGMYRDDSRQGWFASGGTKFSLKPAKPLASQGSYQIEFQRVPVGTDLTLAVVDNLTVSNTLKPSRALSFSYRPSIRRTRTRDSGQLLRQSSRDVYGTRINLSKKLSTSGEFSRDKLFLVATALPDLPTQVDRRTDRVKGGIGVSLWPGDPLALVYTRTNLQSTTLDLSDPVQIQFKNRSNISEGLMAGTGVRITPKWQTRISAFTNQTRQSVSGGTPAPNPLYPYGTETTLTYTGTDNVKTEDIGGRLGLVWKPKSQITVEGGQTLMRTYDQLALGNNRTDTWTSDGKVTMRPSKVLTLGLDYSLATSSGQVSPVRHKANINLRYSSGTKISVTMTGTYIDQTRPHLTTTNVRMDMNVRY